MCDGQKKKGNEWKNFAKSGSARDRTGNLLWSVHKCETEIITIRPLNLLFSRDLKPIVYFATKSYFSKSVCRVIKIQKAKLGCNTIQKQSNFLQIVDNKWARQQWQLFSKVPLLIPSRLHRYALAAGWKVTVKYKHILCHPINLRECYFIMSHSQERRQVKKVIGGLERHGQSAWDDQGEHVCAGRKDCTEYGGNMAETSLLISAHRLRGKFAHGTGLMFSNHCSRSRPSCAT